VERAARVVWSDSWWGGYSSTSVAWRVPSEITLLHRLPEAYRASVRVWAGAPGSGDDSGAGLVPLEAREIPVRRGAFGLRLPRSLPGEPDRDRPDPVELFFRLEAVDGRPLRQPEPAPSSEPVITEFASQFQVVRCPLRFWRWPEPVPDPPPRHPRPPSIFVRWAYSMDRLGCPEPYVGMGAAASDRGPAQVRWAEAFALTPGLQDRWLEDASVHLDLTQVRVGVTGPGVIEVRRTGPRFKGGPWGSSASLAWRPHHQEVRMPMEPPRNGDLLLSALASLLDDPDLDPVDRAALVARLDALLGPHRGG
jgi:hypothetical protein